MYLLYVDHGNSGGIFLELNLRYLLLLHRLLLREHLRTSDWDLDYLITITLLRDLLCLHWRFLLF